MALLPEPCSCISDGRRNGGRRHQPRGWARRGKRAGGPAFRQPHLNFGCPILLARFWREGGQEFGDRDHNLTSKYGRSVHSEAAHLAARGRRGNYGDRKSVV